MKKQEYEIMKYSMIHWMALRLYGNDFVTREFKNIKRKHLIVFGIYVGKDEYRIV